MVLLDGGGGGDIGLSLLLCPTCELLITYICYMLAMSHLVICPFGLGKFHPYSCCHPPVAQFVVNVCLTLYFWENYWTNFAEIHKQVVCDCHWLWQWCCHFLWHSNRPDLLTWWYCSCNDISSGLTWSHSRGSFYWVTVQGYHAQNYFPTNFLSVNFFSQKIQRNSNLLIRYKTL